MHTAGLMQCKDGDYPGTVRSRVVIVLLLYAVNGDNVEFRVFLANLECGLKFGRIAPAF